MAYRKKEFTIEIKTLQRWIDMIQSAKGLAVIQEMREIIRGYNEQGSGDQG